MDDKTARIEAKRRLARLTDLFAANYAQYMSAGYDESNTRTDFIDGFFEEVLDWDVRNKEGASEVYRDVVREDKVKINGQTKAPDYSFRIGGIVKFYVEAKKPSVNIKDNQEPAYQVRRYAWTKKLPLSILTNMREFAVYDTRVKPAENDKANGVDIDSQAVEVTKLSLYLKLLENEGKEAEGQLFKFSDMKLLPSLENNIKCGNSLIGTDFYMPALDFDEETARKVNCFDWEKEFPGVFKAGGFDVVVGNPPYVFTRNEGFIPAEKEYYYKKFKHQNYQLNTFTLFTEQGYYLTKNGGSLGFIIPNNWLTISSLKEFRDFILSETGSIKIVNNFHKVFKGANVDTSMVVFSKQKPNDVELIESPAPAEYVDVSKIAFADLLNEQIIQFKLLKSGDGHKIINKIESNAVTLNGIATVKSGLKAYETGKGTPAQTDKMKKNRVYHSDIKIDNTYRPYLEGRDVKRYQLDWSGKYLKYGTNLAAPRGAELFEGERILVRQIPSQPPYSINGVITDGDEVNDINSMIITKITTYSIKYVLGVINSKLITYWFSLTFDKFQRAIFPQFKVNELEQFPIHILDLSTKADKAAHDKLVALVDKMLELKRREHDEPNPQAKTVIGRQIGSVDGQIDKLVYELYNLTESEIKVVEGAD